jgi:hypothetical protein
VPSPHDEYQQHAEDCKKQADLAKTPEAKAAWLKMADEWIKIIEFRAKGRF